MPSLSFFIVSSKQRGSVTAEQQSQVENWLKSRSDVSSFELSELQDAWLPTEPVLKNLVIVA